MKDLYRRLPASFFAMFMIMICSSTSNIFVEGLSDSTIGAPCSVLPPPTPTKTKVWSTTINSNPSITTVFISYNSLPDGLIDESLSSPSTTGKANKKSHTSLGGGDDDNNNPGQKPANGKRLQTLCWFLVGALFTIPMTEYCLDPLLLIWILSIFGWLSSPNIQARNQQQLKSSSTSIFCIQSGMILLGDWTARVLELSIPSLFHKPKYCNLLSSSSDHGCILDILAIGLALASVICSVVVKDRFLLLETASPSPPNSFSLSLSPLRISPDQIALSVPLIILAFGYITESDIAWRIVTKIATRHHGSSFRPLLGRLDASVSML
jgi:hypothetical protein